MDPYGTHQEALAWALGRAERGSILEIGIGWWSTPLLHGFCEATSRRLASVETTSKWLLEVAPVFAAEWHGFWSQIPAATDPWALVLIDGDASQRAPLIHSLRENCQCLVVHDTEPESRPNYPGMEEALAEWPNRRDFTRLAPHTTVVWK